MPQPHHQQAVGTVPRHVLPRRRSRLTRRLPDKSWENLGAVALAGDGALAGRADEPGVLAEDTRRVARRRCRPRRSPLRELSLLDEQVEAARRDVEPDPIAVAHQRDRTTVGRLRGDMTDTQAGRATGEPAI